MPAEVNQPHRRFISSTLPTSFSGRNSLAGHLMQTPLSIDDNQTFAVAKGDLSSRQSRSSPVSTSSRFYSLPSTRIFDCIGDPGPSSTSGHGFEPMASIRRPRHTPSLSEPSLPHPSRVSPPLTKERAEALERTLRSSSRTKTDFQTYGHVSPSSAPPISVTKFDSIIATDRWPDFGPLETMLNTHVGYKGPTLSKVDPAEAPRSTFSEPPYILPPLPSHRRDLINRHYGCISSASDPFPPLHISRPPVDLWDAALSPIHRIVEPLRDVHISRGRPSPSLAPSPSRASTESVSLSPRSTEALLSDSTSFAAPRSIEAGRSQAKQSDQSLDNDKDESSPQSNAFSVQVPGAVGRGTWEHYAKQVVDSSSGSVYRCLWGITEDGIHRTCNYTAKKQLVKRHIETTHLKFKPYTCDICGKAFPQRTSLSTHKHGHTGSTPHVCAFQCGKSFKDPARRHRHMVETHGYVPRKFKKRTSPTQLEQAAEYESISPWLSHPSMEASAMDQ